MVIFTCDLCSSSPPSIWTNKSASASVSTTNANPIPNYTAWLTHLLGPGHQGNCRQLGAPADSYWTQERTQNSILVLIKNGGGGGEGDGGAGAGPPVSFKIAKSILDYFGSKCLLLNFIVDSSKRFVVVEFEGWMGKSYLDELFGNVSAATQGSNELFIGDNLTIAIYPKGIQKFSNPNIWSSMANPAVPISEVIRSLQPNFHGEKNNNNDLIPVSSEILMAPGQGPSNYPVNNFKARDHYGPQKPMPQAPQIEINPFLIPPGFESTFAPSLQSPGTFRPPPVDFYDLFDLLLLNQEHTRYFRQLKRKFLFQSLEAQLNSFCAANTLNDREILNRARILQEINDYLKPSYPEISLHPFGSYVTRLGGPHSDVDVLVDAKGELLHKSGTNPKIMQWICSELEKSKDSRTNRKAFRVIPIFSTRIPILKLYHYETKLNLDLSFENFLSVQNSKLIGFYMDTFPIARPLSVFIRYWAKFHGLSGSFLIKNYAFALLVLVFLAKAGFAPTISQLQKSKEDELLLTPEKWNAGFSKNLEGLDAGGGGGGIWNKEKGLAPCSWEQLLWDGIYEFVLLYSNIDYSNDVICTRDAEIIPRWDIDFGNNSSVGVPDTTMELYGDCPDEPNVTLVYPTGRGRLLKAPSNSQNIGGGGGGKKGSKNSRISQFKATEIMEALNDKNRDREHQQEKQKSKFSSPLKIQDPFELTYNVSSNTPASTLFLFQIACEQLVFILSQFKSQNQTPNLLELFTKLPKTLCDKRSVNYQSIGRNILLLIDEIKEALSSPDPPQEIPDLKTPKFYSNPPQLLAKIKEAQKRGPGANIPLESHIHLAKIGSEMKNCLVKFEIKRNFIDYFEKQMLVGGPGGKIAYKINDIKILWIEFIRDFLQDFWEVGLGIQSESFQKYELWVEKVKLGEKESKWKETTKWPPVTNKNKNNKKAIKNRSTSSSVTNDQPPRPKFDPKLIQETLQKLEEKYHNQHQDNLYLIYQASASPLFWDGRKTHTLELIGKSKKNLLSSNPIQLEHKITQRVLDKIQKQQQNSKKGRLDKKYHPFYFKVWGKLESYLDEDELSPELNLVFTMGENGGCSIEGLTTMIKILKTDLPYYVLFRLIEFFGGSSTGGNGAASIDLLLESTIDEDEDADDALSEVPSEDTS